MAERAFDRRVARTLLYEELVKELYELIDVEGYKPGDMLPTERELTERFGTSRNVLREAFHVLESRGIITSRQGRGRFLREIPGNENMINQGDLTHHLELYSMKDAYIVRQVLEVKAMELIVENASDDDLDEIDRLYEKLQKKFDRTGTTTGEFELHRMYAEKSGSLYLAEILELVRGNILGMMHSKMAKVLSSHDPKHELKAHSDIIKALHKRDASKAKKLMASHIQDTIDMLDAFEKENSK